VLCLPFFGCATKTTQTVDIAPATAIELREQALVTGDPLLGLVSQLATSTSTHEGFGDTKREVAYVTTNINFRYVLETRNSGWIQAVCGVPMSLGQSAAQAVAGAARYCNPF
jgi:hypothetical protein